MYTNEIIFFSLACAECSSLSKQYNQINDYCESKGRFWSNAWFYDRSDLNALSGVLFRNKTYFVNIRSICKFQFKCLKLIA